MAVFSGNGSNTAPSFTFSSDTNTGLYRNGADDIGIAANGTNVANISDSRMAVDGSTFYVDFANNQVGFGTTSPNTYGGDAVIVNNQALLINEDTAVEPTLTFRSGPASQYGRIVMPPTGMRVENISGSAEAFRVDVNEKLLVRTTDDGSLSRSALVAAGDQGMGLSRGGSSVATFLARNGASVGGQTVMTFTVPAAPVFMVIEVSGINSRVPNTSRPATTSTFAKEYFAISRADTGYDVVLDNDLGSAAFTYTSSDAGGNSRADGPDYAIARTGSEANTAPQQVRITCNPRTVDSPNARNGTALTKIDIWVVSASDVTIDSVSS